MRCAIVAFVAASAVTAFVYATATLNVITLSSQSFSLFVASSPMSHVTPLPILVILLTPQNFFEQESYSLHFGHVNFREIEKTLLIPNHHFQN